VKRSQTTMHTIPAVAGQAQRMEHVLFLMGGAVV
jgi:hypothetical protein